MTFDELGLSAPLLRAIEEKGYREPSPIQAAAIPAVLSGRDLMAAAGWIAEGDGDDLVVMCAPE